MGTLQEGADNAVGTCMGVQADESVLVVTDHATETIGQALTDAATKRDADVETLVLEDLGERPITEMPDAVADKIPHQDVTLYAARAEPGELGLRGPFIRTAVEHARHGHMPGITEDVMRDGMCADQEQIAEITDRVTEAVRDAGTCRVTSPKGTDLEVTFAEDWRWNPCGGIYHERGRWGNLPEGETFTAVPTGEGVVVGEELGDHFCREYGDISDEPIEIPVEGGRAVVEEIAGGPDGLADELRDYLTTDEGSARLGEFAFGTHIFLDGFVGNLLQDEKYPGVHVAFGYPYPDETGADWTSDTHVDLIMKASSAWVDGRKLLEDGEYII